jgi:hypothetical protein
METNLSKMSAESFQGASMPSSTAWGAEFFPSIRRLAEQVSVRAQSLELRQAQKRCLRAPIREI